jgi:hypothetical protein
MPVPHIGRRPNHIALLNFPNGLAPFLDQSRAFRDDQELPLLDDYARLISPNIRSRRMQRSWSRDFTCDKHGKMDFARKIGFGTAIQVHF